MASTNRSELWQALKAVNFPFKKKYQEHTTEELQALYDYVVAQQALQTGVKGAGKDHDELPTQRRADEMTPIRTDERGRVWYQEEIQKSNLAKSRGYRIFREVGTGVKTVTLPADDEGFTETIEVPDGTRKPLEIKVGIPTWQVGIYKDPQLPFRVVEYRSKRGFLRQDVENYFGGADVLPEGIETDYVGNLIAYPIREVIVAIQREYNQLQKKGAVV